MKKEFGKLIEKVKESTKEFSGIMDNILAIDLNLS